jgi:HD-GYP domain-containing protein (c-di-GMP phosphodiesterase class II)
MDGRGYPKGLPGNEIPLGARMMAIADVFDALTASDRPYKPAFPLEQALHLLAEGAQKGQLDPSLVQLWIESKAWEDIVTP